MNAASVGLCIFLEIVVVIVDALFFCVVEYELLYKGQGR